MSFHDRRVHIHIAFSHKMGSVSDVVPQQFSRFGWEVTKMISKIRILDMIITSKVKLCNGCGQNHHFPGSCVLQVRGIVFFMEVVGYT